MLNIILCSYVICYTSGFLSHIYNTKYHYTNLNLKNIQYNPDMDDFEKFEYYSLKNNTIQQKEYLSRIHKQLYNKNKHDVKTYIPLQNLFDDIEKSIQDTNKALYEAYEYCNYLDTYCHSLDKNSEDNDSY